VLEPQERILFPEALRPPEGYDLSWAIGTTYTLDLVAAVAAPLAFAFFDWEQEDGQRGPDPIPLLEALRSYADRLTVFVQGGQIAVPKPQQVLLSYLEDSIIEAWAPTRGGLFHPKIWLLRFTSGDDAVRYRFVCLTRNLTFDRAWDAVVVLEGPVCDRQRGFSANRPLVDFVAALPGLALRGVSLEVNGRIREASREVLRVSWELPPGFNRLVFWPIGIERHRRWPFAGRVDRLLVVSPFLGRAALDRLARQGRGHVLVSRLEALQELEAEDVAGFENIYVLDDAADLDSRGGDEVEAMENMLRGLHAKVYIADAGWDASVWTGSPNATDAALGPNVEFLVELTGPKSKCGIDALLAKGSGEARFGDLLRPYLEHDHRPPDEVEEGLRARIDEARRTLARAGMVARVEGESDEGLFTVALVSGRRSFQLGADVSVHCWPVMLGEAASAPLNVDTLDLARFVMAGEDLSSLFAFSVEASEGARKREERFTLNLALQGAPEDRRERVLRSVLRDRDRVLRFLLFLLAAGDPRQAAALVAPSDGSTQPGKDEVLSIIELPLFESMLRALEREPSKLDHVARVIADLRKSAEGEALIPEGFAEVFDPIWAAREAQR
jgi:hypothetical protein